MSDVMSGTKGDGVDQADVDMVVIGAGFAGIYAVYRFREAGFSVRGFEAAGGVGGTWYWNRYPGARCDSEAMYYCYSFLSDLEQEWPIEERYPGQPTLLRYLETVADRLDVKKHFRFDARVVRVLMDERSGRWHVTTADGVHVSAKYVVTGVGALSHTNVPDIEGAETFAGEQFHTARWPHEPVDLSGKRVGVIGTGSSGIQSIPVIAQAAGHLVVFQRTAQFSVPASNGPLSKELEASWKSNYREWWRRAKRFPAGNPFGPSHLSALDVSDEERREMYESRWKEGGFVFVLSTFNDLLVNEESNRTAAEFVWSKIDEIVEDPEVAEMLKPRTFPFGTKRLPLNTNYYETFNRDNVTLVDLRRTPIERIVPSGVRTTAGVHELDVLVYATGFDALTGALLDLHIEGRGGMALADKWADGPKSYLGLAVPGFPNLFTITGPGSPSVLSNVPLAIEQHVEWLTDLLGYARDHGIERIEATDDATRQWSDHVQDLANATLHPRSNSWYMGANIPGKPRLFLPYIGGLGPYRDRCAEIAARGYPGFVLEAGTAPAGTSAGTAPAGT